MSFLNIALYSTLAVGKCVLIASCGVVLEKSGLFSPKIRTSLSKVRKNNNK